MSVDKIFPLWKQRLRSFLLKLRTNGLKLEQYIYVGFSKRRSRCCFIAIRARHSFRQILHVQYRLEVVLGRGTRKKKLRKNFGLTRCCTVYITLRAFSYYFHKSDELYANQPSYRPITRTRPRHSLARV